MKLVLLSFNIIFLINFNLQAQPKDIATLSQEVRSIQSTEGSKSFAYANKLIELAQAHQVQKEFSSATALIQEINAFLQIYTDSVPTNYEDEFAIKNKMGSLRLEQLYLIWQGYFWQEQYDSAQAVLDQKDWIERCIRQNFHDKVRLLLAITQKQLTSQHGLYLDNWQKAYLLYTSPYLYNLKETEKLWASLCEQRKSKFGNESPEHLEVLFAYANFCDRTNKIEVYDSLRLRIKKHWPHAFGFDEPSPKMDSAGTVLPISVEKDKENLLKNEILTLVEEMPRFPGCEHIKGAVTDKKNCADRSLLRFIYSHIKYPEPAQKAGIEGMVVLTFVVTEYGTISNINILRNPGGACGEEALRVVKLLNELPRRWVPGKQKGKKVRVKYHLPVRFKLT